MESRRRRGIRYFFPLRIVECFLANMVKMWHSSVSSLGSLHWRGRSLLFPMPIVAFCVKSMVKRRGSSVSSLGSLCRVGISRLFSLYSGACGECCTLVLFLRLASFCFRVVCHTGWELRGPWVYVIFRDHHNSFQSLFDCCFWCEYCICGVWFTSVFLVRLVHSWGWGFLSLVNARHQSLVSKGLLVFDCDV